MGHVYYHHPGDNQFSLDFVHHTPSEIVARIVEYDDDVAVKVRKYDLDREFFVIYTSRVGGGDVGDLEFDLGEALSEMGADNGTIVAQLLEIYQALIAQNEEEEGVPVEAYRNIDIDALPDALNRTSWGGSATDVAGRLASNIILKHAFPNGNHRTAVALTQFYLRRIAPGFSMPETSVEVDSETYDWREWVNEYINDSKRLLTVRRKNVLLKHLADFGATTLEREHEVQIDLTAYDLDMYPSEAKAVYVTAHEELWIEFVEEAVERTDNPN